MSSEETPYRTPGVPAAESGPSDSETALALAAKLLQSASENGPEADEARAELASVSRAVSDLVADQLVLEMASDALSVCAVFSNHTTPLWFASSRDKLVAGLEAAQAGEPLVASFLPLLGFMPLRREGLENAGTGRRLLSVLTRAWVIAFVWLPAIGATVAAFSVDSAVLRLGLLSLVGVLFVLAFAAEAYIRACPECGRFLAAMPVGVKHAGTHTQAVQVTTTGGSTTTVNQSVDSYNTLWRCVHCKHRWER